MYSKFEDVNTFKFGAYCSASERSEIDTPFHAHHKGQFIYAQKGTQNIYTDDNHYFLPVEHFIWITKHTTHRIWTNNSQIVMFTIYFDQTDEQEKFFEEAGVYTVNNLLHECQHCCC
ncbi:AraC family ligand binding domain-containing protein [Pedobacter sp. L105]|uniref:AraC family ligand binding domain-containing protein n=1 Tax=Pedobacter sp. L105 TaxID=1641871 RepID=UPI00131AD962|nr:AraC family ligand binding domain-containing protein [Pedobacter sp. L105]